MPGSPAISDLVDAVYTYVISVYYPGGTTAQLEIELKSIARTAINSYVNNLVIGGQAGYNAAQFRFIEMMVGSSLTSNLSVNTIGDRITDIENNLTDNQLTVSEQTPLLLAATIGFNAATYWNTKIIPVTQGGSAPTPGPWAPYLPPNSQSYLNLPFYVAAAMNGALAAYGATPSGMVEPSVNFVTNKMVSALIGALTVTAGKVIFNWIPRIQHVNPETMLNLGSGPEIKGEGSGEFGIPYQAHNIGGGWTQVTAQGQTTRMPMAAETAFGFKWT